MDGFSRTAYLKSLLLTRIRAGYCILAYTSWQTRSNDASISVNISHNLGPSLAVLIVITIALLSYLDDRASKNAELAAEQSRVIIDNTQELLLQLTDAETGERGYLLTGNPQYLKPYQSALPEIERLLGELDRANLVFADVDAKELRVLAREKLAGLARSIEARRSDGADAALAVVASNRVKRVMDRFRAVVARVIRAENAQYTARSAAAAIHDRRSRQIVLLGSIVLAL